METPDTPQTDIEAEELPDLPVHFHFAPDFPRNAMGKIQRFKLRQRLMERQLARA